MMMLLIFAVPLSGAFLHGLAMARDPHHRLIPEMGPWPFFWRGIRRRLRFWWLAWVIYLIFNVILSNYVYHLSIMTVSSIQPWPWFKSLYECILSIFAVLMLWLLGLLACALSAPYCQRVWSLVSLTILGMLASSMALLCITPILIAHGWRVIYFYYGQGNKMEIDLSIPISFLLTLLATAGVGWWIKRRGERWFRFEE